MSVHYRLRLIGPSSAQIHQKGGQAFQGYLEDIITKAFQLGIPEKYLLVATNELARSGHDYADFDRSGTLLYTRREKW